jgi:hypothetical protein
MINELVVNPCLEGIHECKVKVFFKFFQENEIELIRYTYVFINIYMVCSKTPIGIDKDTVSYEITIQFIWPFTND